MGVVCMICRHGVTCLYQKGLGSFGHRTCESLDHTHTQESAATVMSVREAKVGDAERESDYGFVFGVSGPGMCRLIVCRK